MLATLTAMAAQGPMPRTSSGRADAEFRSIIRSSIDDMQFGYSRIWPALITVAALLLIYRRFRRSFGAQRVVPVRMGLRMAVLLAIACAMLPLALKSGQYLAAEIAGLAAGTALGLWGAAQTRYQARDGHTYYIPHTYTGIAVSLLFIGRLVYRIAALYSMDQSAMARVDAGAPQGFAPALPVRSPMTVGLLFVVIGYYVCYYGTVLWKYKRIGAEDLEAPETSPPAAP
jgi:hypothetical protein